MQLYRDLIKGIFSYSSPLSIGLDIGNFSVKIAQIKKGYFHREKILSFAVAPIKENRSRDSIIRAIKQAYSNLAAESKKVNLSICGQNIIIRYIVLPTMKEADLSKAVEFELERYVPFKREEVVIDYRVLGEIGNNKIVVLLAAAERRLIQERFNLVKDAGLEPQLINIDALALAEAFKMASPHNKGVSILLDFGYRTTKLVVLQDEIPYFSRDIEIGKFDIIQAIPQDLAGDFDLTKEWEDQPKAKAEEIDKLTQAILNNLVGELSLSFEYCERNLEKKIEKLYLTGGGSKVRILLKFLEKTPNFKINLWNPAQKFRISPSINAEDLKEYNSLLAVAIGLAIG